MHLQTLQILEISKRRWDLSIYSWSETIQTPFEREKIKKKIRNPVQIWKPEKKFLFLKHTNTVNTLHTIFAKRSNFQALVEEFQWNHSCWCLCRKNKKNPASPMIYNSLGKWEIFLQWSKKSKVSQLFRNRSCCRSTFYSPIKSIGR